MKCQKCKAERVVEFNAKCPDGYHVSIGGKEINPFKIDGLCDGEYLEPKICLSCGQCQGAFPATFSLSQEDEIQEIGPHEEDLFVSVKDWLNAVEQHTCSDKKMLASDMPPNHVGMLCGGCGKGFFIALSNIRKSVDSVSSSIRKSLETAKGRQYLAKSYR